MLVLSRRQGESIVINEQTRITVLEVRGQTIRLGIEAPREVSVHRAELLGRPRPLEVRGLARRSA